MVIVTHNSEALIESCVAATVRAFGHLLDKIIIVDNGSVDITVDRLEKLKASFPAVQYIELAENLGFGAANNIGVKKTTSDFIALVNPDLLLNEGIGSELATNIGIADAIYTAPLYYPDGKRQANIGSFKSLFSALLQLVSAGKLIRRLGWTSALLNLLRFLYPRTTITQYLQEVSDTAAPTIRTVDWVSGAFMFLPRSVWSRVDGFNERFFLYVEDEDFCRRAKTKGIKTMVIPSIGGIHSVGYESKSSIENTLKKFYWRSMSTAYYLKVHVGLCASMTYRFCAALLLLWKFLQAPRAGFPYFSAAQCLLAGDDMLPTLRVPS